MCSSQQRVLERGVDVRRPRAARARTRSPSAIAAQREQRGQRDAHADGDHEVEGDGRHRGDDQQHGVAARRADDPRRRADSSTIRTAVTISTPASAASGMSATTGDSGEHDRARTTPWTIAATRVRAPARTLTAVRAIAPVAGIPPNEATTATLARPWPTSSRSGSCGSPSAMPSATLADSRLSIAAERGDGERRRRPARAGRASATGARRAAAARRGSCRCGRVDSPASSATSVATATAISDAGSERCSRGSDDHHDGDERRRRRAPSSCRRPSRRRRATATAAVLLAVRLGHAERGRHLLEEDQQRDPEREALDTGHGRMPA